MSETSRHVSPEGTPRTATGASGFAVLGERDRLLAAMADVVHERGYAETSVALTVSRAGLDQAAFERHFATKEDCFIAAFDAAVEGAFAASAQAYMNTSGSPAEGVHSALGAFLDYIAHAPSFAYLCCVEAPGAGAAALAHRYRAFELFMEFLEPGFAQVRPAGPPPRLVAELIAGGIFELLRRYVEGGRLAELPAALPAVTVFTLAPFFGLGEAQRVAAMPLPERAAKRLKADSRISKSSQG